MTPVQIICEVAALLKTMPCKFALIGGHAASLYRNRVRFTNDVDFALVASRIQDSRIIAESCLQTLGLQPMPGFIPLSASEAKHESPRERLCLIGARAPIGPQNTQNHHPLLEIDLLLPELPWVIGAVTNAQKNQLNFGAQNVPVITVEDLIVAKCFALENMPDRFQDLDDLKEIFSSNSTLDKSYIIKILEELKITVPKLVATHWQQVRNS